MRLKSSRLVASNVRNAYRDSSVIRNTSQIRRMSRCNFGGSILCSSAVWADDACAECVELEDSDRLLCSLFVAVAVAVSVKETRLKYNHGDEKLVAIPHCSASLD
eukprot:scaffold7302_cov72-Cyclotella_meneghiniana.AAC.19